MGALHPAQVIGDLAFQYGVDGFAEVVAKQHIFRRDGAVGFQFEHPMSVRLPEAEKCARRCGDAGLQGAGFNGLNANGVRAGMHLAIPVSAAGPV